MRIVKTDAGEYQAGRSYVDIVPCFAVKDTVEITDEEWHIIWRDFKWTDYQDYQFPFAQYLKELVLLRELK